MNNKTVLVTGNMGYIGSIMVPMLVQEGFDVIGYDIGYYEDCYIAPYECPVIKQIRKDIRDISSDDLDGVDYIIHLAGLSNDPLGEFVEDLTYEINYESTIKLAQCARNVGVKRFIYTSSQSVYGISDVKEEVVENSIKNPITAYAKTKWLCECALQKLCTDEFIITYMRPATAYGMSPNLRCDIVFNAFTAYAYTNGLIEIKSDGTPWRPMSHVKDISMAFIAALKAPEKLIKNEAFNIGTFNNNYTVKQLAEIAQSSVSNCKLIFTNEHTDPRSYRVSSEKILTVLKQYYKPLWDIPKGCNELLAFYKSIHFDYNIFNSYKCNRLKCLKKRIEDKSINNKFRLI